VPEPIKTRAQLIRAAASKTTPDVHIEEYIDKNNPNKHL
jgi:hypothetical protein